MTNRPLSQSLNIVQQQKMMAGAIELLDTLEHLGEKEFKIFKWYLQQTEFLKTVPSIPKSQLENSDRPDTVDLMVATYSCQCVEVARMVLQRMQRNDLVERLSNAEVASRDTGTQAEVGGYEGAEVLACDGEENQLIEPIRRQPLNCACPPPPQPSDRPAVATSEASEAIIISSSSNLLSSVSVEIRGIGENEEDPSIHPSDALSTRRHPENVKISGSSRTALQATLQDMFSSAEGVWWKQHQEESLWYMDPELFITDEHGQLEVTGPGTETSAPMNVGEMFQRLSRRGKSTRTVLTKGSAGIGKSFLVQAFISDWAEKRDGQDFHLVLPFDARQLRLWRGEKFTLVELVHMVVPGIMEETLNELFTDLQKTRKSGYDGSRFKLLIVIDGLDQSLLQLDLISRTNKSDVTKSSRIEVHLTNLITGKLLPAAHLWITTQCAPANLIPPECVDMVTELRGFSDQQKERYIRRRVRDEQQASKILSHIQTSHSLRIMCHTPAFCYVAVAALEDLLETRDGGQLPLTLTETYAAFLVAQIDRTKRRYDSGQCIQAVGSLAQLAFQQLLRDNALFTKADMGFCGLTPGTALECSQWFPEIFKQLSGRTGDDYQKATFCFAQSSIQKFLAAVHVIASLLSHNNNVLTVESLIFCFSRTSATKTHKTALKRALKTPNGKLDLFLRFIMGLSLQRNQFLLRDLLSPAGSPSWSNQKIVSYVKRKIRKRRKPDGFIVLFHCLNELREDSVVEEIQWCLRAGNLSTDKLSAAHWSALVFILMSSEKHLDEFNLSKYSTTASEDVLLQLLPVLKASSKALLTGCRLSERSLEVLSLVLSSASSSLKELDLSDSDLEDSGVKQLCVGLQSPSCKLQTLRMSGCLITEAGCEFLASALSSNPSHLQELDLSYNHPGESGSSRIVAGLEDPGWRLKTLRLDHCGEQRLLPGIRKYACELELDLNTANRNLKLSSSGRKVRSSSSQTYPDHPDRFDFWPQVLCRTALTGRCYWEVKWRGLVDIAVSYRGISRKGLGNKSLFGANDRSWTLVCFPHHFTVVHKQQPKRIPFPSRVSNKIAVYVDYPAGLLSFYTVSSDARIHLHTFSTTFTEPLYAGFGCDRENALNSLGLGSSVFVCPLSADESPTPATK